MENLNNRQAGEPNFQKTLTPDGGYDTINNAST